MKFWFLKGSIKKQIEVNTLEELLQLVRSEFGTLSILFWPPRRKDGSDGEEWEIVIDDE